MKFYPHAENCRCGASATELPLKKDHDWYVHSRAFHNCFWTYLRHNTRPHTLSEVAKLMKLSISAITSIERKAYRKLKKRARQFELEKNK